MREKSGRECRRSECDGFNLKLRLFLQALRRAFEKRDIEAFRESLHKLEDIESIDDNRSISLFEEICQTPGCAAFISECLHFGCDVNKVSVQM